MKRSELRQKAVSHRRLFILLRHLVLLVLGFGTCGNSDSSLTEQRKAVLACPEYSSGTAQTIFRPDLARPATVPIGATPGQFGVDPNGNGMYLLELNVPPGRNGLQPKIAISYNSSARTDGLLGVAFELLGLSAVARCGSNLADDGKLTGIRFDASDNYCLDGMRLVPVASDGDSTEYRTQPDTHAKVVMHAASGHPELGPRAFRVFYKNGLIAEYGGTVSSADDSSEATSRIMATGGIISSWAVSRLLDRFGNFMSFTYMNQKSADGGYTIRHAPQLIAYTGHQTNDPMVPIATPSVDQPPLRSVQFQYQQEHFEPSEAYVHGLRILAPPLLTEIDVSGPIGLIRKYVITYDPIVDSTGTPLAARRSMRDRIHSVQEVAADGVAKPPTMFVWKAETLSTDPYTFSFSESSGLEHPWADHDISAPNQPVLPLSLAADVNGDGVDDLVDINSLFNQTDAYDISLRVALGRSHGVFETWGAGQFEYSYSSTATWHGGGVTSALPLDYNQDGRSDLLIIEGGVGYRPAVNELKVAISDGHTFAPPVSLKIPISGRPFLADVNGDGVTDIIQCDAAATQPDWIAWIWSNGSVEHYSSSTPIPALTGHPCSFYHLSHNPDDLYKMMPDAFAAIDLDGDGADELLVPAGGDQTRTPGSPLHAVRWDWSTSLFTGPTETGLLYADLVGFRVLDLNGDGLRDIVSLSKRPETEHERIPLQALINTGAGFQKWNGNTLPMYEGTAPHQAAVMDLNGDGADDLLIPATSGFNVLIWRPSLGFDVYDTNLPKTPGLFQVDTMAPASISYTGDCLFATRATDYNIIEYSNSINLPVNLLLEVHDGLGASIAIDYTNLIDVDGTMDPLLAPHITDFGPGSTTGRYFAGAGCTYPVSCVRSFKPVVMAYHQTGVHGDAQDFAFSYRDARIHRLGRGWLGFAEIRRIKPPAYDALQHSPPLWWLDDHGRMQVDRYDNVTFDDATKRFPNQGLLMNRIVVGGSVTASSQGQPVCEAHKTDYAYSTISTARPSGRTTYHSFNTQQKATAYSGAACLFDADPGGTLFSSTTTLISPVAQSNAGAGNIESVSVSSDLMTSVQTQLFKYEEDDPSRWLIGKPTSTTVHSVADVNGTVMTHTRYWSTHYENGEVKTSERAKGDRGHRLVSSYERDPFGNVTRIATTGTDLNNEVTREACMSYETDEHIFPFAIMNGLSHATYTKYDRDLGVPLELVDPDRRHTQWTYDAFGWRGTLVEPDGTTHTYVTTMPIASGGGYSENRVHIRETATNGLDAETEYDSYLRPIRTWSWIVGKTDSDADRVVDEIEYDQHGRSARHTWLNSTGATLMDTSLVDAFGREFAHIAADNSRTDLVHDGLTTTVTHRGADGTVDDTKLVARDAVGRVSAVTDAAATKNAQTLYHYGPFNHLWRLEDPARHAVQWEIDGYGFVKRVVDPDRGTRSYTYTSFGELSTEIVESTMQTTTYYHDALGRVRLETTNGKSTSWHWDPVGGTGRVGEVVSDDSGSMRWSPDELGRVRDVNLVVNGASSVVHAHFQYDPNSGLLKTITYPELMPGFELQYSHDSKGQPTGVSTATAAWTWSAADTRNRIVDESFGNGLHTARSFDDTQDGALTSISTTLGTTTIQNLTFAYDARRQLLSKTDHGGWDSNGVPAPPHSESFCHDGLGRLTDVSLDPEAGATVCGRGNRYHYEYALDGNIASKSDVGSYTYNPSHPHAVQTAGSLSYSYDANGNQATRSWVNESGAAETATVLYNSHDAPVLFLLGQTGSPAQICTGACTCGTDSRGQPICAQKAVEFTYIGDNRVFKKDATTETIYFGGLYEQEKNVYTGRLEHRFYLPSPERIVGLVTKSRSTGQNDWNTEVDYLHVDHLGSFNARTASDGSVRERRSYDPFGAVRSDNWADTSRVRANARLGFTGAQEDRDIGLVNLTARQYDPTIGRFVTADNVVPAPGSSQGWNPYSYVYNSPLNFTDPSGHGESDPTPTSSDVANQVLQEVWIRGDKAGKFSLPFSLPSGWAVGWHWRNGGPEVTLVCPTGSAGCDAPSPPKNWNPPTIALFQVLDNPYLFAKMDIDWGAVAAFHAAAQRAMLPLKVGAAVTAVGAAGLAAVPAVAAAIPLIPGATPTIVNLLEGTAGLPTGALGGAALAGAGAAKGGLAHLTGAGNAIAESGTLIGRSGIYATSLETAGNTGIGLTLRTGLSPSSATAGIRIPAAAEAAFSRPIPIGPITTWQRAFGTQYTAAGTLDLATGVFTRAGVNWNQVFLYGVDAAFTGTAVGIGVSYALDR